MWRTDVVGGCLLRARLGLGRGVVRGGGGGGGRVRGSALKSSIHSKTRSGNEKLFVRHLK